MRRALSTVIVRDHNPATPFPNSRPIRISQ